MNNLDKAKLIIKTFKEVRSNMYESPVHLIFQDVETQMNQEIERTVINVVRKFDVDVDKDELIKALNYDRNQYNKGYKDGANDTLDKLRSEIADLADYDAFNDTQQAFNLGLMKAVEIIDKCRGGRALLKKE